MARRVFFSFHYDHDVFRSWPVRNSNVVATVDGAGFFDEGEYRKAKAGGDAAIKRMIDDHLGRSTVTCVLIGTYTHERPWVRYEIAESVRRDMGLVGITIHGILAPPWFGAPPSVPWVRSRPGLIPSVPAPGMMPVYEWDPKNIEGFAQVIEEAGQRSDSLRALKAQAQRRAMQRKLTAIEQARALGPPPSRPSLFDALGRQPEMPPWRAPSQRLTDALRKIERRRRIKTLGDLYKKR